MKEQEIAKNIGENIEREMKEKEIKNKRNSRKNKIEI